MFLLLMFGILVGAMMIALPFIYRLRMAQGSTKAAAYSSLDRSMIVWLLYLVPIAIFVVPILLIGAIQKSMRESSALSGSQLGFLSSNRFVEIGGHRFLLPVEAMRENTFAVKSSWLLKRLQAEGVEQSAPIVLDKIDVKILRYIDGREEHSRFCEMLTREWAKSVCRGSRSATMRHLPERFTLIDRRKLELMKHYFTMGRENQYDQIRDMTLRRSVPEIGCDKESKFCTAALQVMPKLIAVWTVWPNGKAGWSAEEVAEREGNAVFQFVNRGLVENEDPDLMTKS
ncbi:MAG: hypothetical protein J0H17_18530 [Rhizobiales bacterium]|nr:hypothetical protein [Hyphomicrobiales bacterium]